MKAFLITYRLIGRRTMVDFKEGNLAGEKGESISILMPGTRFHP
jgi:hypothetical protein